MSALDSVLILIDILFDDMACEACESRFTLFKRKKQCKDCLRFYCTNCVIRRSDRVLSCGNCSMLSRRPLIRSQVLQMKSKDLKQYLIAKKVSLRGCVEKEDLVNILIEFANGAENQMHNEQIENISETLRPTERSSPSVPSPRRSRSPPINIRQTVETVESPESEHEPTSPSLSSSALQSQQNYDVEIEEITVEEDVISIQGPEPIVTEQDEVTPQEEENNLPSTNDNEHCNDSSPILIEGPSWSGNVTITDINERSDLDFLNVKQLKNLLRSNRIDFRGCVERCELLDRASRLWDAHNKSREDLYSDGGYEESLCKICWDSPIECVILECGHMVCCINCGKQMNECPICRQYVVRVVRFFKS